MITLEKGQIWRSKEYPHEDFKIYDRTFDSFVLSDIDTYFVYNFNELPESAKIYLWQRINEDAFNDYIVSKKGEEYDNTYPYAWAGESKKQYLVNKIKKYNMELMK